MITYEPRGSTMTDHDQIYTSECWACDDPIRPGDVMTGRSGTWRHLTCPNPTESPRPVCGSCFLTIAHNGTCGCEEIPK